jgi:hypothetical protein
MLTNEVDKVDNMVRGLEKVVKDDEVGDDVKEKGPVDYTKIFTTDKVCTYLAHNILY